MFEKIIKKNRSKKKIKELKWNIFFIFYKASFNILRTVFFKILPNLAHELRWNISHPLNDKIKSDISVKKKQIVSIYTMILPRLEVFFLEEWIEYYLLIGVDNIYIYDNGPLSKDYRKFLNQEPSEGIKWSAKPKANYLPELSDEEVYSKLHSIINKYPNVHLKEWHHPFCKKDDAPSILPTKIDAYMDCMKNNQSDWWIHIDPDEFIFFKKHGYIKNFLKTYSKYSTFHIKDKKFEERKLGKPILENIKWTNKKDVPTGIKSIVNNNIRKIGIHRSYSSGKLKVVPSTEVVIHHYQHPPMKEKFPKKYIYNKTDSSLLDFYNKIKIDNSIQK